MPPIDLEWKGDTIVAKALHAAGQAMDAVASDWEHDAAADTPVLTGAARDSVFVEGTGLDRTMGYGVPYGIFIEIGANGRAGHHALRRSGDRHFGQLAGRTASRLQHG
jgi:hypothetical protein